MELRAITLDDLELFEAIHCDPAMMAEIGGPLPREGLAEKLRADVAEVEADVCWYFKIIPDPDNPIAAGTVVIWEREWQGEQINEIGWMVLPAFQGRGIGSQAVRAILERARSLARWDAVHAFPPVTNARSNAMCRKMEFVLLGTCDYMFRDHSLRCNHWRLDLRAADSD